MSVFRNKWSGMVVMVWMLVYVFSGFCWGVQSFVVTSKDVMLVLPTLATMQA